MPLGGGEPIDPFDGLGDLERRLLRAVGERSFAEEPLRLLRAPRLAAELGLELDPGTAELARAAAARAAEPAGERQLAELRQLLGGPDPLRGLRADRRARRSPPSSCPRSPALRGVEQGPNHHLDVHGHTLAVLEHTLEIEADLAALRRRARRRGRRAARRAARRRDEPRHGAALRRPLPRHRQARRPGPERDGFVGFRGHDAVGAEVIGEIFAAACAPAAASPATCRR